MTDSIELEELNALDELIALNELDPFVFLLSSTLFSSGPLCVLLGSPLFPNGLSYVFHWASLCVLMGPLNSPIGFSIVCY